MLIILTDTLPSRPAAGCGRAKVHNIFKLKLLHPGGLLPLLHAGAAVSWEDRPFTHTCRHLWLPWGWRLPLATHPAFLFLLLWTFSNPALQAETLSPQRWDSHSAVQVWDTWCTHSASFFKGIIHGQPQNEPLRPATAYTAVQGMLLLFIVGSLAKGLGLYFLRV